MVGKTTIQGGHLQLNLSGGRNIVVKVADSKKPAEDVYKTSDLLRVSIPNVEVLAHLRFEEGFLALIDGGENAGQWGEVVKIGKPNVYGSTVTIRNAGRPGDRDNRGLRFPYRKRRGMDKSPKGRISNDTGDYPSLNKLNEATPH